MPNVRTEHEPGSSSHEGRSTPFRLLVGFLLLAGVTARMYGAWCTRNTTDPDAGIVFLMAKHMAEGGPWPVFFYGQAYMGSLEPMIGALFCKLGGVYGMMVTLSPALAGILLLPVIYAWTRDAAGTGAGAAALAYSIVGPYYAFTFQAVPRGGYPLTHAAGANLIAALLAEADPSLPAPDLAGWVPGRVMLRYDEAVFVSRVAAGLPAE